MLLRHKGVEVGSGFRNIVKWLSNTKESLPERKIVDVKRIIRWIREGECSRRGFIDLKESVERAGVWEEFCAKEGVAGEAKSWDSVCREEAAVKRTTLNPTCNPVLLSLRSSQVTLGRLLSTTRLGRAAG